MKSLKFKAFSCQLLKDFQEKLSLIIIFLFGCGIFLAFLGLSQLSINLIDAQALQHAQISALALNKARAHYSESIVQRLDQVDEVVAIPNYASVDNAIPNPVTFAIELGESLSQDAGNISIRLYSNYPFPNRQTAGGPQDNFEAEAIAFLEKHPQQSFYRKEQQDGQFRFRYAEPVIMEASCVACHNTLPESPKNNWQVGDVRGVISIIEYLDQIILIAQQGVRNITVTLVGLIGLAAVGILCVLDRLRSFNRELTRKVQAQTQQLEEIAITDSLTQLYNRHHFDATLKKQWRQLQRLESPLSLILIDIDYFKKYNDTYGHIAGDNCLQVVAKIIQQTARRSGETAARYGGEEFGILLPNSDQQSAIAVAEILQGKLREANLPHGQSLVSERVTVSMGLATIIPDRKIPSETLVELADKALYEAKEQGRNCYVCSV